MNKIHDKNMIGKNKETKPNKIIKKKTILKNSNRIIPINKDYVNIDKLEDISQSFSLEDIKEWENINNINNKIKNIYLIILPDYTWKKIWDNALAILLVYVIIFIPLKLSFYSDVYYYYWNVFDYFLDSLFFLDIIFSFFTAYVDEEENFVIDRFEISKKYLKSWFILDVISVFPFDLILNTQSNISNLNSLFRFSKLPKLSKFIRITKIFKSARIIKNQNNIWTYIYNILKLSPGFDKLILNLFSIFIFCHLFACIWYLVATLENDPNGWICNRFYGVRNNILESYLASLYWVTQTVITVGYGDIGANTNYEKIIAIIVMFAGVIFFSLTVSSLTSILSDIDASDTLFERKFNTLLSIQEKYNISPNLFSKVKNSWKNGKIKSDERYNDFLKELPMGLKRQLGYKMHINILKKIDFFNYRSKNFLSSIGPLLKKVSFNFRDLIFNEGDYSNEMYFILSGTVTIIIKEFENLPIINLKEGHYFGELDLFLNNTRTFSYIASTELELLSLEKSDFLNIFINEFPKIGKEMETNSTIRKKTHMDAFENAKKICYEILKKEDSSSVSNDYANQYENIKNIFLINKIKEGKYENENEKEILNRLSNLENEMTETHIQLENIFKNLESSSIKKFSNNHIDEEKKLEEESLSDYNDDNNSFED